MTRGIHYCTTMTLHSIAAGPAHLTYLLMYFYFLYLCMYGHVFQADLA